MLGLRGLRVCKYMYSSSAWGARQGISSETEVPSYWETSPSVIGNSLFTESEVQGNSD